MYKAHIVSGKGKGRTLGFPTLNCIPATSVRETYGVYIVQCIVDDSSYYGVANWGLRPTYEEFVPLLEIHILDTAFKQAFSAEISVSFVHYIRPSKRFNSEAALKKNIADDVKIALAYLKDHKLG